MSGGEFEAGKTVLESGGDEVPVYDGGGADQFAHDVAKATSGGVVQLAIDAIGGEVTGALAASVAAGQRVVNYGLLSGKACEIDSYQLVFRGVTLQGFWLASWFRTAGREKIKLLYRGLIPLLANGTVRSEIAATYPMEQFAEAMRHAKPSERGGKILLVIKSFDGK